MALAQSTVELASGLRLSCVRVGPPDGPTVVMLRKLHWTIPLRALGDANFGATWVELQCC